MHTIIDADGLIYAAAWKQETLDGAIKRFNSRVQEIVTHTWTQDKSYTLIVEGAGNWRKDIFPKYKGNRKVDAADPYFQMRSSLYQFLRENKIAISAVGCESDDLVRRKATTMMKRGQPFIVASIDKDLDMIEGPHIRFDQRMNLDEYVITKEQSDFNFYYQLLIGDMGDNIRSPKGMGAKTAERLLLESARSQWKTMIEDEYKARCGKEWLHALYFTGSLVFIQRWKDDFFSWDKTNTWSTLGFSGAPTCYPYV